jgi:DNA-binding NarL/FixJ family response regulator
MADAPGTGACLECVNAPSTSEGNWKCGVNPVQALRWISAFQGPLPMRHFPDAQGSGFSARERDKIMSSSPSLIRILAVDDHPLLRECIASLIASQSDMKLVAEASTGREALEQFRKHRPDLTLMDLQMPDLDGIEAMLAICSEFPEARIIVLTTYKGDIQVLRALKAGARAYLLKGLLRKELLETIRAVHAGRKSIPPEVASQLAEHAIDDMLSMREIEVLRLVARGNANKLIADQLSITEETVKFHVRNILSKLGASDRTQAVTIALKRGIIEL